MAWKEGAATGEVLAGGNGRGYGLHQLNRPTGVVVDREIRYSSHLRSRTIVG